MQVVTEEKIDTWFFACREEDVPTNGGVSVHLGT